MPASATAAGAPAAGEGAPGQDAQALRGQQSRLGDAECADPAGRGEARMKAAAAASW